MFKDIQENALTLTKWTISALIDSIFLITWVVIQYGTDRIISSFKLSGISNWEFFTFQVIFAVSTLIPVVIYIYKDISIMWIRVHKEIKKAKDMGSETRKSK